MVSGQLFIVSSTDMYTKLAYTDPAQRIVIDFTKAHLCDAPTISALDFITRRYEKRGKTVDPVGLNTISPARHKRRASHRDGGN